MILIRKKIFFGAFTLFFLFLLLFITFAYNNYSNKNITPVGYVTAMEEDNNCNLKFPEEDFIILRIDDIGANRYVNFRFKLVEEILNRDMKVLLGVIPYGLDNDKDLNNFISKNKNNPKIEMAQHGYTHESEEFKNLDYSKSREFIINGLSSLNKYGVAPSTFVPPSNEYSEQTILVLTELGFRVVVAKDDEYKYDGNLFYLGKTTETYDFYNKRFIPFNEVLDECKLSLNLRNICVVSIHPQDYLREGNEIDPVKFDEFLKLLDGLKELNVKFVTPRDFFVCDNV